MAVIKVHLKPHHVEKLMAGNMIQLPHSHLVSARDGVHHRHELVVSSDLHRRYHNAVKSRRGLRLSPDHIDGGSLKDVWNWIKNKAQKVGKFYVEKVKPVAGPLVRKGLGALLDAGESALALAQPELIPGIAAFKNYAQQPLIDKLGSLTHAYGIHMSDKQARRLMKGHIVQLSGSALGAGISVGMHHHNYKKISRAHRAGKGVRLQLDPYEISLQGEGLKEFLQGARKAVGHAHAFYK
jgi:hypothetical protein